METTQLLGNGPHSQNVFSIHSGSICLVPAYTSCLCPPAMHCCQSFVCWLYALMQTGRLVLPSAVRAPLARAHLAAHQDSQGPFTELLPRPQSPACVTARGSSFPSAGIWVCPCWILQGSCQSILPALTPILWIFLFTLYFKSVVPLPLIKVITCIKTNSL